MSIYIPIFILLAISCLTLYLGYSNDGGGLNGFYLVSIVSFILGLSLFIVLCFPERQISTEEKYNVCVKNYAYTVENANVSEIHASCEYLIKSI